jgi:hypothetical protein
VTKKREFVTEVDGHKLPILLKVVNSPVGMFYGMAQKGNDNVKLVVAGSLLLLVSCEAGSYGDRPYCRFVTEEGEICGREIDEKHMEFDTRGAWFKLVKKP